MKVALPVALGAALTAIILFTGGAPALAGDLLVENLRLGREKLESVCTECHKLDKPFSKDMNRAQWDALLLKMVERGAQLSAEERGAVVDFLTARLAFSTKCTVCHTEERVFDPKAKLTTWSETVAKMAKMNPDLISDEDAKAIISYLELTLGIPPEFMQNKGDTPEGGETR